MDITNKRCRQHVGCIFSKCLLTILVSSIALCGTARAQTLHPRSSPGTITADMDSLLLAAGDLVEIQVFDTPELSAKVRVSERGTVALPAGGQVSVVKLTALQAAATIESRLRDSQVMTDPHVTVFVDEYATQGVTVLGEVRNPGTYTLLGEHSLYRAISAAGGTSINAGGSITLRHQGSPDHPVLVPLHSRKFSQEEAAMLIEPGDIIVVAKADLVYVVGDVGHPGAYYEEGGEPISVLNALALASGLNHTALASKASIIRKTPDGATTIPLDLNRIMKNKASDVVLQASDILVVPRSGTKVLLETALPGATAAVTGAVTTALVLR